MTDTYSKNANGRYTNNLPWPIRPAQPDLFNVPTEEMVQVRDQYEAKLQAYYAAKRAYAEEEGNARERLRRDLEEETGLKGHERADLLWQQAWDAGHASGLHEVIVEYHTRAELLQ